MKATILIGLVVLAVPLTATAATDEVTLITRAEKDGSRITIHEVVVPADPAQVWAAISTAAGWKTWAAPKAWTIPTAPEVIETSYDMAAEPGDPTTIKNQIVGKVPGRTLTFRTTKAPDGFKNVEALVRVVWTFELVPAGPRQTRVKLTGTGYPPGAAGKEVLDFFSRGNRISLQSLHSRFAEGPVDWSSRLEAASSTK